MKPRGAGPYARAIERAWGERAQRPVVLTRDWARVADWHARGVPLAVVEEALEEAAARAARRGKAGPERLASIAPAVEESWRAIVDGRTLPPGGVGVAAGVPEPTPEPPPIVETWRDAAAGSPAAEVVEAALEAFLSGSIGAGEADQLLEGQLETMAGDETRRRVEREVDRRLEGFAGRLGDAELARTRRRACREGLRRALLLARLDGAS